VKIRPAWILALGSVAAAVCLSLLAIAQTHALERPCPSGERSVAPSVVHLHPTLVHHQNWIGLPTEELGDSSTWVYACSDGVVVGVIKGRNVAVDPSSGMAQIKVLTRWVDLAWLAGDLAAYQNPDRWQLVYSSVAAH
jgi:hypothetical protein